MYDKDNVFAKILRKELPAKVVYEDDEILSFYTIQPLANKHILVIPKGEYRDYQDFVTHADDMVVARFFKKIDEIAREAGMADSYRVVTNYGKDSGQVVFHFHVHLMAGNIQKS